MQTWEIAVLMLAAGQAINARYVTRLGEEIKEFENEEKALTTLLSEGWEPLNIVPMGTTSSIMPDIPDEVQITVVSVFIFKRLGRNI